MPDMEHQVQSDRGHVMERNRQQQTVNIARGLFLVRYAAAEDQVQPPTIKLSPDPAPNKDIWILVTSGSERGRALAAEFLLGGTSFSAGETLGRSGPPTRPGVGRRNRQN